MQKKTDLCQYAVLFVDDEEYARGALAFALEGHLPVITAGSVDEALEILARRDPGGILSQIVPRLTLRQAIALGLFQFAGDMPDIDSEMWSKIFDKVVRELSFPIAVESLIKVANRELGDV